ncbi:SO_0444 family Cu/Zn efflux transporter [Vibrio sp.]|uniref:Permease n=1 Tax=Vibrio viridaestus TaxID=2487322 RepID=A0A3N9TJN5_9VIBR|nr:SO_0444 family Cu/Zn efflux transporter [Vibrio viridaestus]MDC0612392.1 SO_0444 family Cu/Zn efflux transporter [Vibrio sp.]RQW64420.1 permease [Vibrio viridaestus]
MDTLIAIGHAFLELWLDAAFWLVFGLIIAGLLNSFINSENIGRHLQGSGIWPAIKAAILGTPLPLCSCGVIPAAVGLRRAGASKSATTAFLISTPETGVDSIAVSYALLGPFMTVIRPIAAICSAIAAAALVLLGEKTEKDSTASTTSSTSTTCTSSCGCHSSQKHEHEHNHLAQPEGSFASRLWQGQKYAFTELLEDLSVWLIVGLVISAIVVALVPYDALADISRGPGAMIIMALIGVPMYICASASTPLAAGLMLAGVSPGAILVFLLAGPATNIATLGIVKKELGWHALVSYLVGVIAVAIGFGYLTNYLVDVWNINISSELASSDNLMPTSVAWIAAIFLAIVVIKDVWNKIAARLFAKKGTSCGCHSDHCH